jgi:iron complex outermembrane receptor protein
MNPNGQATYQDLNGDGLGSAYYDRTVVANALPTLTYAWSNRFYMGSFELDCSLRGAYGHHLVNTQRMFYENANLSGINQWNRVKTQYWDDHLKQIEYSDRFVENANYLKLDYVTLRYHLNCKDKTIRSATVFVTGNNLWVWTNYTGIDPEVRYADPGSSDAGFLPFRAANPDPLVLGIDRRSTYWNTRSVTVGLNLSF